MINKKRKKESSVLYYSRLVSVRTFFIYFSLYNPTKRRQQGFYKGVTFESFQKRQKQNKTSSSSFLCSFREQFCCYKY